MKVIFISTPIQDDITINPQVIDGKIYHWVVRTEKAKICETLQEFLQRKWEYDVKNKPEGENIKGFFIYNVSPVGGIVGAPDKGAMFVRYDYIR